MSLSLRLCPIVFAVGLALGVAARAPAPRSPDIETKGSEPQHASAKATATRGSAGRRSTSQTAPRPADSSLASVLAWLPHADAQAIIDQLARWDESAEEPPHPIRLWCLLRLGELDPVRAFQVGRSDHDPRRDFRSMLATHLASLDPARFRDSTFLASLDLRPWDLQQVDFAVRQELDPYQLFLEAKGQGRPLEEFARRLAESDPAALAAELNQLGPTSPGFHLMARTLVRNWAKQDEDAARAWLADIDNHHVVADLQPMLTVSAAFGRDDRSEGARLVASLPPGSPRSAGLARYFATWAAEDFEAAAAWVSANLPSHERAGVLANMSEPSVRSNPLRVVTALGPHAAEFTSRTRPRIEFPDGTQLDDPTRSASRSPVETLQRAVGNCLGAQREEARILIESFDLPKEIRQSLLSSLPPPPDAP